MQKVRIDRWLWSVRIFKSRTIATNQCKSGHVFVNNKKAKPSSEVVIDDIIGVSKNRFRLTFQLVKPINKRVSAPLAAECYIDLTPAEELNKFESWFIGKGQSEWRQVGLGRPTKKERRQIDEYKYVNYLEEE